MEISIISFVLGIVFLFVLSALVIGVIAFFKELLIKRNIIQINHKLDYSISNIYSRIDDELKNINLYIDETNHRFDNDVNKIHNRIDEESKNVNSYIDEVFEVHNRKLDSRLDNLEKRLIEKINSID